MRNDMTAAARGAHVVVNRESGPPKGVNECRPGQTAMIDSDASESFSIAKMEE